MKRIVSLAALLLSIAARGQNNNNKKMTDNKTLVVWFSWSQNTETMAKHIAEKTGADLFRIERVTPYPTDYNECAEAGIYISGEIRP